MKKHQIDQTVMEDSLSKLKKLNQFVNLIIETEQNLIKSTLRPSTGQIYLDEVLRIRKELEDVLIKMAMEIHAEWLNNK